MSGPEGIVRLSPAQAALLRRIVATNGGGTGPYVTPNREYNMVLRLHELGLAQGKAGNGSMAVHTHEGLAWVRANHVSEGDPSP